MATHLWRCHSPIHHNRIFCRTKRRPALAEIRFPSETQNIWTTSVRQKTSEGKIERPLAAAVAGQPRAASARRTSRTGQIYFRRRRTSRRHLRSILHRILHEVSSKIGNRLFRLHLQQVIVNSIKLDSSIYHCVQKILFIEKVTFITPFCCFPSRTQKFNHLYHIKSFPLSFLLIQCVNELKCKFHQKPNFKSFLYKLLLGA